MILLIMSIIPVSAITGGTGPSAFVINGQLLTDEVATLEESTLTIYNYGDEPIKAHFELEGEISNPSVINVNFEEEEPVIQPGESREIKVTFVVKSLGTYSGKIHTYLDNLETQELAGGAGATIGIGTITDVKVIVQGEAPKGQVRNITVNDVEINKLLHILTDFENKGRVTAQPVIFAEIYKGDTQLEKVENTEAIVQVGENDIIDLAWDTTGQGTGEYRALVSVMLGEETLEEKEFNFSIKEPGSLKKEGKLIEINLQNPPQENSMAKVIAVFENSGGSDVAAEFAGELYRDGILQNTIKSESIIIFPGETSSIASYITLEEAGQYTIKGHVNYEGLTTEEKEYSFFASSKSAPSNSASSGMTTPLSLLSLFMGGTLAILLMNYRRR